MSPRVAMAEVGVRVAAAYRVSPVDLYSRSRLSTLVSARHVAMWLCLVAGYSTNEVGRHFDRDHTTVMHARDRVEHWLGDSPTMRAETLRMLEAA